MITHNSSSTFVMPPNQSQGYFFKARMFPIKHSVTHRVYEFRSVGFTRSHHAPRSVCCCNLARRSSRPTISTGIRASVTTFGTPSPSRGSPLISSARHNTPSCSFFPHISPALILNQVSSHASVPGSSRSQFQRGRSHLRAGPVRAHSLPCVYLHENWQKNWIDHRCVPNLA